MDRRYTLVRVKGLDTRCERGSGTSKWQMGMYNVYTSAVASRRGGLPRSSYYWGVEAG